MDRKKGLQLTVLAIDFFFMARDENEWYFPELNLLLDSYNFFFMENTAELDTRQKINSALQPISKSAELL